MAEPVEQRGDKQQVRETTQKREREHKENEKEQVSEYSFNRGYYSRNGGDKGYRGL